MGTEESALLFAGAAGGRGKKRKPPEGAGSGGAAGAGRITHIDHGGTGAGERAHILFRHLLDGCAGRAVKFFGAGVEDIGVYGGGGRGGSPFLGRGGN